MKTGAELIADERREQIVKHGWDEGDDDYTNAQLVSAAVFCIEPTGEFRDWWPTGWHQRFEEKIINKSRIDQLTVAGAFIAAEIDRLQRLQE